MGNLSQTKKPYIFEVPYISSAELKRLGLFERPGCWLPPNLNSRFAVMVTPSLRGVSLSWMADRKRLTQHLAGEVWDTTAELDVRDGKLVCPSCQEPEGKLYLLDNQYRCAKCHGLRKRRRNKVEAAIAAYDRAEANLLKLMTYKPEHIGIRVVDNRKRLVVYEAGWHFRPRVSDPVRQRALERFRAAEARLAKAVLPSMWKANAIAARVMCNACDIDYSPSPLPELPSPEPVEPSWVLLLDHVAGAS